MSRLHQLGFSNRSHWEIYLKGAGKTLYARLAELNFPATRSLCVIAGDEMVNRQGFEPAAILVRLAPSHIRFGAFENYGFQRNTRPHPSNTPEVPSFRRRPACVGSV